MLTNQIKYDIFSYIQEYDKFATNFQGFECNEEVDGYYIAKYQSTEQMGTDTWVLKDIPCKVSKQALQKWIEKRQDQQLIDNGIILL